MSALDVLAGIKALAEAATPGPWQPTVLDDPTRESKERYYAGTLSPDTPDAPLYLLTARTDREGLSYVIPALTGDGPTSAINAEFIAAARSAVPRLVAAVEAVLNKHSPHNAGTECRRCGQPYPCPDVRDITAALEAS